MIYNKLKLNDDKTEAMTVGLVLEVAFLVISRTNVVIMRFLSSHL